MFAILDSDTSRADLIEAIGHVNGEAKRQLRYDNVGRPNARWADLHAFINSLLDLLGA